jgi:3-hydroxyisobutyrate dehydrogenase-like beta-hydroxyacid dehydrogenase
MGYLMARNLANHRATHLEQQPPLLVWNRSKDKSEKLLHELGGRKVAIADTVVDIATKCDIVLTSLASDEVVKSVYKEIAAALQARSLHVVSVSAQDHHIVTRHNLRRRTEYL